MNTSGSIIVWEWEAQANTWVPYPPIVCQHIENEYKRSMGSAGKVDLSQLGEIELTGCEIHFNRMKQINVGTSEIFKVRRHSYPNTCPFAKGVYWKWWTDVNWQLYDVPTSNYIEDEFQKKSKRPDLRRSPIRIPNFINFSSMQQINKRTKYSRKIQREETKDQYLVAKYETTNMPGQCGTGGKHSYNPMQPSTSAISNSAIQPGVGTSTSIFNPSVGSNAMSHSNRNALLQFGSNYANILPTTGSSTMTPSNNKRLTMQNTLPLRHISVQLTGGNSATPSTSHAYVPGLHNGNMNLNNVPSNVGVVVPQPKSAVPVASNNLMLRKQARQKKSRSPTPKPSRSISGPLGNFTRPVQCNTDDECAICLESLSTPSEYDNNPTADVQCVSADILQLLQCKHIFHRICLQRLYESGTTQSGCLRCPTCKTIHGVMKGNQPTGGTMAVTTNNNDIPGYPGHGSIVIQYNFRSGVQGPNHPNPGQPYSASAFPRTCYLPNNPKGKKVLKLLKIAFDRQLVFTVGRSVTTGQDNTIVWNDIHHKTEGYGNGSGYGYPDPNYLDNVLAELASHGVTDDQ